MTAPVILTATEIGQLDAEMDRLLTERQTADTRIAEICRLLVGSGEARLRDDT
jgi:hypothetical protein